MHTREQVGVQCGDGARTLVAQQKKKVQFLLGTSIAVWFSGAGLITPFSSCLILCLQITSLDLCRRNRTAGKQCMFLP